MKMRRTHNRKPPLGVIIDLKPFLLFPFLKERLLDLFLRLEKRFFLNFAIITVFVFCGLSRLKMRQSYL